MLLAHKGVTFLPKEAAIMTLGAAAVLIPFAAVASVVNGFAHMEAPSAILFRPGDFQSAPAPASIDQRELECLALNIYHEARDQSRFGQLSVGLVTITRMRQERWPDTLCEVVNDPHQFSWVGDDQINKNINDHMAYLNALDLSSRLLHGEFDGVLSVFNANHYHSTKVRPKWTKQMERLATIGDHVFYVD